MMSEPIPEEEQSNYETFRECLSEPVLRSLSTPSEKSKKRRRARHKKETSKASNESEKSQDVREDEVQEVTEANDAEDLGDFIDYLTSLLFPTLASPLRTLSYSKFKHSQPLQDAYSIPLSASTTTNLITSISPTAIENLTSYSLLPSPADSSDLQYFFTPIFTSYIGSVAAPPPIWSTTRTTECELCHREWIPLTYHHLIPRSTHDRVVKRGWHTGDQLNAVAWLCRACHSFVHRVAENEELARRYYSVELLEGREDVQAWVKWVGRVRWKKR